MELLVLSPDDCYPLRALLLGGKDTLEQAGFPQDLDEGALHLGFKDKTLLGVVSILPDRRDGKREMWRLAGLVVAPDQRGAGLGRKLLTAARTIVDERGGGLWAEAPLAVAGFLEACGFQAAGPKAGPAAEPATASGKAAAPSKAKARPKSKQAQAAATARFVWAG